MIPNSSHSPKMTGIIGNQQQQQQQQQNQQQQQQQIYDGVLYCWGEKYSSKPSFNAVVPNIVSLQSGFTHSLALTQEGEVYAWGDNRSSQLGVTNDVLNRVNVGRPRTVTASGSSSPFTHSPVPILLSMSTFGGQRVRMIAAGGCYSAAVLENGLLYTWGTLDDTQSSKSLATPTKVDLLKGVICVALGLNHVAVVAETNTPEKRAVYTWGSNRKGQLGVVGDSITSAPRKVTLGARALTVSCGDEFTAAIVEGNEVFVWGNNRGRQIASNNTDDVLTIPVKPFLGRDIVELSCSRNYIAARSGGGAVYIWGNNEHVCRAGDNDKTHTIPSGCRVKQISAGLTHLLALTEKGEVYVLGSGDDGQLGALEDKKSTSTFKKIAALEGRTAHFVHAWARCSSAVLEPGNFRVEISETMRRQENRTSIAPYFLRRLVHYIRGDNSKQEGIFRLSGSKARVDELERRLDLNEQFSISAKYEIYDAADNMKRYFKSLPEPICTNSLCARFERQIINTDDLQEKKTMIKEWISLLPKENRVLLIYLLSFLGEVVETQTKHMGTNAMGAKNLALVFAPNLLTKGEIGNDDVIEVMINMFDEIIADYPELESSLIIDQAEDGLAYQSVAKVPYIIELWSRTMAARESAKRAFFEPAVLTFIIDAIVEGSIESRGGNANRSRSSSFNLGNGNGAPANGSLSASGNTPPSQSPMHSPKRVSSSQYKPINGNTSPILYGSHSSPQLISTTPLVQFSTSLNSSTSGIYHSSNSNNQHISQAELQRNYEQILSLVLSPIISIKNLLRVLPSIVEIDVNSLLIKLLLANKFVRCITNNLSNTMNDSINQIKDIVDISQYNEKIKQLNSTFESLTSDVMFIEETLSRARPTTNRQRSSWSLRCGVSTTRYSPSSTRWTTTRRRCTDSCKTRQHCSRASTNSNRTTWWSRIS
ncbi:regulator of chromosome condensation domain-containing protein [Heterostelium album PN500]|uniref:Regulator of chromosome condensation domain-containing protein n=1 Tax=Heterostelium pallidum (strain ATCC 26659 / Pp 5 / PN500) TaxID=670386 RepID=D3BNW1_HETP5|nr:regulator of chromosome condensation domain-containing protein [Heterostelium album PN500]EFA76880.1 regulator of chromosome condensation domain-containing protein [Heterostelium album PN500]|eukprot:XP_020429012.1 regulator of chromosome condensation domain-containing protein [Heterostelium album PN500]